jgi:hypothetical protein
VRIALLGWGSLIWDKGELPLKSEWKDDGPEIPIEFSRISSSRDGALTLVIDPENGAWVSTFYAESKRNTLEDAICDLRTREGTLVKRIGFVNLLDGSQRSNIFPEVANIIRRWASDNDFDAVIWTDLPSNFKEKTDKEFELEEAVNYLKDLPSDGSKKAREYILNTPDEIQTPLGSRLRDDPWLNRPTS